MGTRKGTSESVRVVCVDYGKEEGEGRQGKGEREGRTREKAGEGKGEIGIKKDEE